MNSSWETASWHLNSSGSTAYLEMLDLQTEICRPGSHSYHVVPRPRKFEQSLHTCRKLSGQLAAHSSELEFTEITNFMTRPSSLNLSTCGARLEDGAAINVRTWLASDDNEEEGVFRNFFTNQPVEHQPWAPERPYVGGTRYNCMVLDLVLTDHGQAQPYLTSSAITDEECGVEFCQANLTNQGPPGESERIKDKSLKRSLNVGGQVGEVV